MFVSFPVTIFSGNDLSSSLNIHLPLDEGSGTSLQNTGSIQPLASTLTSGGSWVSPGKVGQYCVDLDGSAGHIVVPSNPAIDTIRGPMTMSMWINPDTWGSAGGLEVVVTVGNLVYNASIASKIQTGTWQLIGWTYDGSILQTWFNGIADGAPVITAGGLIKASNSTQVWFGGNPSWSAGSYLNGKVDDIRVYNRALNAADWLDLYNFR